MNVSIRRARPEDIPFVISSWVRSHRNSRYASELGMSRYHARHPGRVELLARSGLVLVAVLPDDENLITGFVVGAHPDVLHYAYTKLAFRKAGVAQKLLSALKTELGALRVASHETYGGAAWCLRRGLTHDPFAMTTGG